MRPRVTIIPSKLDRMIELSSKIVLPLLWAVAIYAFIKMPEVIPTHFGASGKADDYGSKMTIWILPLIATIIYFGLTLLNKYPHIFNYPSEITEANAQGQYTIAVRMLRFLKLAIVITAVDIVLSTYLTAIGVADGLGVWLLPLILALFFIPIAIALVAMFRKGK